MATKKTPTKARAAGKRARQTNIFVLRFPQSVKQAIEAEAQAAGQSEGAFVRSCIGAGLLKKGYELAPETRAALGV